MHIIDFISANYGYKIVLNLRVLYRDVFVETFIHLKQ